MKYIFIFGNNPKISKLELAGYFKREKISYKVFNEEETFIGLELNQEDINSIQNSLAGTIRIAELYLESNEIDSQVIESVGFFGSKNINYSFTNLNLEDYESYAVAEILKQGFKELNIKATNRNSNSDQIPSPSNYHSWNLKAGLEIFGFKMNDTYLFAKTISCSDPEIYKKKDIDRPSRFFSHGTSPKLAQMMVNSLGLPEESTIVDPFCGTGTFLIEGLRQGYKMIGIDNDKELVASAEENLAWAIDKYKLKSNAEIILGDARNTNYKANACVFEPYMGPFLKKLPTKKQAVRIIDELNDLYYKTFKNLSSNLIDEKKVVCILPDLKTKEGEIIKFDRKIFSKTGFKMLDFHGEKISLKNEIEYSAPDGSKIVRHLFVLEKIIVTSP